jgi:hypothetical protein
LILIEFGRLGLRNLTLNLFELQFQFNSND